MLVLDEPTAGLDPAGRENLMANIRDYHRNKKRTLKPSLVHSDRYHKNNNRHNGYCAENRKQK